MRYSFGRSSQEGFSLIEVLIALAVFSIGILAVASLQITSTNGNALARKVTEATAVAKSQMEYLTTLAYDHNDLNPALNPHETMQQGYTLTWDVADDDLDGDGEVDSKLISLSVHFRSLGNRTVSLSHIIPVL
jgi:prepilin-type N-terminal cleavage/methylation domain-containing protein